MGEGLAGWKMPIPRPLVFLAFVPLALLQQYDVTTAFPIVTVYRTKAAAAFTSSSSSSLPLLALSAAASSSNNNNVNDDRYAQERFSVAPMMGHTNRHYRYFFRLLSKRTHLYTEMIPSSMIVRTFQRARRLYIPQNNHNHNHNHNKDIIIHPEEVWEVMDKLKLDPSKEYQQQSGELDDFLTLQQLLLEETTSSDDSTRNVVLQLGGNDPQTLGAATLIGAAFSNSYSGVNLNCGCPSNAVAGGRNGGCALMKNADWVARCVDEMHRQAQASHASSSPPIISVKHRLGVREAATFDTVVDRAKNDDQAFQECRSFVRTVSLSGAVPKFHVHARLGLLGEFAKEDGNEEETNNHGKQRQSLWTPGGGKRQEPTTTGSRNGGGSTTIRRVKIDHKREQYFAKQRARKATILNRNVPPLRPNVVHRLAEEFPHLQFVANGGIQNLETVKQQLLANPNNTNNNRVVGAMVGRAAINHPCSFAAADCLWGDDDDDDDDKDRDRPTRGQVLQDYIAYCDNEEDRLENLGASARQLEALKRRLIAVPFHLFTGERGSDIFQRRLTKLKDKCSTVKASSILLGAAIAVPPDTMDKCVDDFVSWENVAKYEGGLKRGSAMQKVIY